MSTSRRGESANGRLTALKPEATRPGPAAGGAYPQRFSPGVDGLVPKGEPEAAIFEPAEGISGKSPFEHGPGPVGPVEGGGRRDPPHDLEDAALVDPVLGPAAGELLDARHLHPRHRPGGREPPHPVAVGVAG